MAWSTALCSASVSPGWDLIIVRQSRGAGRPRRLSAASTSCAILTTDDEAIPRRLTASTSDAAAACGAASARKPTQWNLSFVQGLHNVLAAASASAKTAPTSAPSRTSDRHQASVSAPSATMRLSVAVASFRARRAAFVSPRASARSRRVPGSRQNQLAAGSGGAAGAATVLRSSSSPSLGPTRRFSSSTKPSGLRAFAALPIASRRRCRSSAERFAPADLAGRCLSKNGMRPPREAPRRVGGRSKPSMIYATRSHVEHYLLRAHDQSVRPSRAQCRPVQAWRLLLRAVRVRTAGNFLRGR